MTRSNLAIFHAVTGFFLLFALFSQARVSVPGDMAWLGMAAESFLSGGTMTRDFLDNNPPLCYLVYLPVALMARAGVPLWAAGFIYGAALLLIATFIMMRLLKVFLSPGHLAGYAIIWSWLLSVTVLWQIEFANKDHLIALMLLPFLMAQYALTQGEGKSVSARAALVLGTPFILMKPHYGLLCVLMLAHRFWRERRFSIVFDFDFLCLAVGTVLYIAVTLIWFPDFIAEVLPAVSLGMYSTLVMNKVLVSFAAMALFSGCLTVLAWLAEGSREERNFTVFLCLMALAAAIPFVVQLKGFSLHMIPFFSLIVPAAAMTALLYLKAAQSENRRHVALIAVIIALLFLALPRLLVVATHGDYRKSELAAYISSHAEGSSFLMQSVSTNIVIPLSVYTGIPHATRFSSFWFLGFLSSPEQVSYFANMVAEDLDRFKPAMVALYRDPAPGDDIRIVFAGNASFAKAWENYYKADEMTLNSREFYKRTFAAPPPYAVYDVYLRK
ncbi:MAG: hypothetical protein HYU57_04330 [Micavibrio aeruginosavorus]|nr:hypothetical protein [Micavibrio aeruginosavorus]